MSKTKQNYHDPLNKVRSMIMSKKDNDMNNSISLLYAEKETKLTWPIW